MGLKEIHKNFFENQFPMPDVSHNVEYATMVHSEKGDLIVGALVKKLHEVIFLTDMAKPLVTRMKAFNKAADEVVAYFNVIKGEQMHCFVHPSDARFAQLLIDRFHFNQITDIGLVRNLG